MTLGDLSLVIVVLFMVLSGLSMSGCLKLKDGTTGIDHGLIELTAYSSTAIKLHNSKTTATEKQNLQAQLAAVTFAVQAAADNQLLTFEIVGQILHQTITFPYNTLSDVLIYAIQSRVEIDPSLPESEKVRIILEVSLDVLNGASRAVAESLQVVTP